MKIILVEDDPTDMKLFSAVLTTNGHKVIGKVSAMELADAIEVEMPDIILLDLNLPVVNGLELATVIKSNPLTAHVPIVAVTAAREQFPREDAIAAGCDAYIVKPINTRELNRIMSEVAATVPSEIGDI